jgi:putative FmdB family regulatory protein
MPTYEYACTNPDCGHTFSAVQTFTEDSLTECLVCGGRLRKVYGAVGVVFKGSGFYRTDSRQEANSKSAANGKSAAKATEGASSSDGKSAGTKTEKPGPKSAAKASAGPS